jgi:catechol 2,3-dioxygenase-like lactoylglutathione lyase family enzyme
MTLFQAVSHHGVRVRDQDEAKAFYTEKLGLEVRQDATLDELGGYRWLTVGAPGQPELNLILERPGPPALDEETAEQVLALVAKGAIGAGILNTDDCRATCRELEARGVELTQQPEERFYGIDASFRDPSGNQWRVVQPIEFDLEAMQNSSGAAAR